MTSCKTSIFVIALAISTAALSAQKPRTTSAPVTDSAAQASPIAPTPKVAATDSAAEASPVAPAAPSAGAMVPAHTALRITLTESIDSGKLKNGQSVHAKLANDVPIQSGATNTSGARVIRAGLPATLTVVGSVPAGKINSVGELSLQLVQIGNQPVDTEVLTFRGQPGKKEIADAAPELGTNAGLASGSPLTFHTQPSPLMEAQRPTQGEGPGAVNGIARGMKPAPSGAQDNQGNYLGPNQPAAQKQSATPQQ